MTENQKHPGYFPDAEMAEREWYLAKIEPQSDRLLQNEITSSHAVLTILTGANAGGAVAVLAYIGQAGLGKLIPHATEVLALFIFGFMAAMFLALCLFYLAHFRVLSWVRGVSEFYDGNLSWRELWSSRRTFVGWRWVPHVMGWLSVVLFIAGATWGIMEMLCAV